jgi:hemolysin III
LILGVTSPSELCSRVVVESLKKIAVKPRLRGVSHQWAFVAAIALGIVLVVAAPPGRATLAAAIYASTVIAMFGVSALYHRHTWISATARRWMRRLDHSMIFLLIAGTYTPFALLVLDGSLADAILIAVWGGALAGIVLELLWVDAPRWLTALVYVVLGWVAIAAFPELVSEIGLVAMALVAGGGVLYTLGAVVYAVKWPDPVPAVFGYHEIFHVLVIGAAALHYSVVAFYVLPESA